MYSYLTPATLEAIYRDLDESRMEILKQASDSPAVQAQYSDIMDHLMEVDQVYSNLTGEFLRAKDIESEYDAYNDAQNRAHEEHLDILETERDNAYEGEYWPTYLEATGR